MSPGLLTLQSYQTTAAKTDRIRKTHSLDFLLLGLFGEVGTLMDEVKKKQRDTRSYVGYEHSVIEELGDVLWYLSTIASHSNLKLNAIARSACGESIEDFTESGTDVHFDELQPQHNLPLKTPTSKFERTLLRLVSAIGELATAHSTGNLTDENLGNRISNIFGMLLEAANQAEVTLERAATENLEKIIDRWPDNTHYPPLFDEGRLPEEQLPRAQEVDIFERVVNPGKSNKKEYVLQRCNGILIGDRVTDNITEPDDYRFHDVFHYSYAVVLGWSPVIRALFRLKRKGNQKIDEGQDGARAILIEEGVSTFIFAYAKQLEFFEGQKPGDLSFTLLKRVKEFVHGYEAERCPIWLWERAILEGYDAFRFLRKHRRGRLILADRSIKIEPLPE
jgi:NTP pyrophosphatase (non-canonical NTP hydrolase)